MNLKDVKTIFFDYDGTLHNSIKIYEPAFIKAYQFLREKGLVDQRDWNTNDIAYWLGFTSKEMWKEFLPEVSHELKMQASKIISEEMKRLTELGCAELYPNVLETLSYLKDKGYKLVFLSNCGLYYMETHRDLFQLDRYFDFMACSEQNDFKPKYEILNIIKEQFPKSQVIVGDRFHDIESGIKNNILTIGCSYGYGTEEELSMSDLIIESIDDLKQFL